MSYLRQFEPYPIAELESWASTAEQQHIISAQLLVDGLSYRGLSRVVFECTTARDRDVFYSIAKSACEEAIAKAFDCFDIERHTKAIAAPLG